MTAVIWAAGLLIGLLFGGAWGYTHGKSDAPLPVESDRWREGYVTGYDDAREECLRIARAHDFHMIETQLGRMEARP